MEASPNAVGAQWQWGKLWAAPLLTTSPHLHGSKSHTQLLCQAQVRPPDFLQTSKCKQHGVHFSIIDVEVEMIALRIERISWCAFPTIFAKCDLNPTAVHRRKVEEAGSNIVCAYTKCKKPAVGHLCTALKILKGAKP